MKQLSAGKECRKILAWKAMASGLERSDKEKHGT
jgi:hypothetical protein